MNLKKDLLWGIYAYGFEKPSAIQQRVIVPCVRGHDVIVEAQSGTGRTATFSISILQQIDPTVNECQALIVVPTHELAQQTREVVLALGDFMDCKCHACIGGTNIRQDMRQLEEGAQVVVGTPERVYDMIIRKCLKIDRIKVFVLDEADEMFSRGFKEPIHQVFKHLPEDVQIISLSTFWTVNTLKFVKQLKKNPISILAGKEERTVQERRKLTENKKWNNIEVEKFPEPSISSVLNDERDKIRDSKDDLPATAETLKGIKQYYVLWKVKKKPNRAKWCALCKLFKTLNTGFLPIIIFCDTWWEVIQLEKQMVQFGDTASFLHERIHRKKKKEIIKRFRSGAIRILVTTDIARTLDRQPKSLPLIINYALPECAEDYDNCIYRMGLCKTVNNFVTEENVCVLNEIAELNNIIVEEIPKAWHQNEEPSTSYVLNDESDKISSLRYDLQKTKSILEGTKQYYVLWKGRIRRDEKIYTLCKLLKTFYTDIFPIIVFCSKPEVDCLIKRMAQYCNIVTLLHERIDQEERKKIIERIRSGSIRILITSDIARTLGLQPMPVPLIINSWLPLNPTDDVDLIHRMGFGKIVINLVTEEEKIILNEIAQWHNIRVEELPKAWDDREEPSTSHVLNDENDKINSLKDDLQKTKSILEGTKQYYVLWKGRIRRDEKIYTLCRLLKTLNTGITPIIVFCATRWDVIWLKKQMVQFGDRVSFLHDSIDQEEREEIIDRFRSGSIRILITTDIARTLGLQPRAVPLIINYFLPCSPTDDVDLIHRTGFFGKTVINIVTEEEKIILNEIAQWHNIQVEELPKAWDGRQEPSTSHVLNDDWQEIEGMAKVGNAQRPDSKNMSKEENEWSE